MQPLEQVGRASRFDRGDGSELWRLEASDQQAAEWLTWLGTQAIGGFTSSGTDQDGPWLIRELRRQALTTWLQTLADPVPWRKALEIVRGLARLTAVCESNGWFPGALNPHNILYDPGDGSVELRAEPLVASALGGADSESSSQSLSSRWVAPEQASGAGWDAAGNRYVLGLVLYRLLANEHPFGGMGLRLALEQARRGAAPMREEVATTLPPGLQTFCLRMLEPDPTARPQSSQALADKLGEFLEDRSSAAGLKTMFAASTAAAADPVAAAPQPARAAPSSGAVGRVLTVLAVVVPVLAGVVGATVALSGIEAAEVAEQTSVTVAERASLTATGTKADDCAYCHPRQTAQWHRSVMAHAAKSPAFQALEMLIQEQVGRDDRCPNGAGALRGLDPRTACRAENTGLPITGSGGELWCVNCHLPGENLNESLPKWDAFSADGTSRQPLRDLMNSSKMEGISCAFCHQVHGPVSPGNEQRGLYEGNPTWRSVATGERFFMRPEDLRGVSGIANSGYLLDPNEFLAQPSDADEDLVAGRAHRRPTAEARSYLRSSQFCGSCHDVRLFGSDAIQVQRGEHFKRLRNAYTEWVNWAELEKRAGREPASCMDCHMSLFPGTCVRGEDGGPDPTVTALARACPPGTHFEAVAPGTYSTEAVAIGSAPAKGLTTHYFSGVDVPLTPEFDSKFIDQYALDAAGIPLGAEQRRDLLLGSTFRFELDGPKLTGSRLEVPVVIENVGAGHKVPAGFSQEREFWVHLKITDGQGETVYEVGRVDRGDEDLHDKEFLEINVDDSNRDGEGRPLGLFGADVADGPDHPQWDPNPEFGGTDFRGKGLINLQNGFLRCVTCIGEIDRDGHCQPGFLQGRRRADRYDDGKFDIDTGVCESNLSGRNAFFEVYYPVGSLDATRGVIKGPDAIIDTRSASPGVPMRYVYDLSATGFAAPFTVEARLMFRAFPPFLVRAFAEYEALQASKGLRPSGPLVPPEGLERLEPIELHRVAVVLK